MGRSRRRLAANADVAIYGLQVSGQGRIGYSLYRLPISIRTARAGVDAHRAICIAPSSANELAPLLSSRIRLVIFMMLLLTLYFASLVFHLVSLTLPSAVVSCPCYGCAVLLSFTLSPALNSKFRMHSQGLLFATEPSSKLS